VNNYIVYWKSFAETDKGTVWLWCSPEMTAHAGLRHDEFIPLRLRADGWGNKRINEAIATIGFGNDWPDTAQATAYKLCNYGGYLK
jgi:hypothetical protein